MGASICMWERAHVRGSDHVWVSDHVRGSHKVSGKLDDEFIYTTRDAKPTLQNANRFLLRGIKENEPELIRQKN